MKTIRHFCVVISDLKRSLRFYRDLLGLKVDKEFNESGVYIDNILGLKNAIYHNVKMSAENGSTQIELAKVETHESEANTTENILKIGASHICFETEDLDALYKRLVKDGVDFICQPQLVPQGVAKVTFCKDPDGTLIELVEILKK